MGLIRRPWRVRALTVTRGDEILGIGGFAYQPLNVSAFIVMAPGAQRHALTLHRAGLMMMAEARRLRIPRVVAEAQKGNPAAERWLVRLGFRPVAVDGNVGYVWQNDGLEDVLAPPQV